MPCTAPGPRGEVRAPSAGQQGNRRQETKDQAGITVPGRDLRHRGKLRPVSFREYYTVVTKRPLREWGAEAWRGRGMVWKSLGMNSRSLV